MPDPPPKLLFETYELGRLLGAGAFSKVYHARHTLSGRSVAIKIINKSKSLRHNNLPPHHIPREISAMRRLRHPHIIRLLEVLASRSTVYLILEFAKNGELFSRLSSRGRLPEPQSRRLFHQLISAVSFCHSNNVFHRDLKPENLLLDDSNNLKLSDFGLSGIKTNGEGIFHTLCGTPAYVAPEILMRRGYEGAKVDVWSCGVILFVMNAGFLPFNDGNLMAMYRKICRGEFRCPKGTSGELRRLIEGMLDTDPGTRITVEGIMEDPWFRKGLDVERMGRLMRFREDVEERMRVVEEEERDLNAFDIICMAGLGFDLSGFFEGRKEEREMFVVEGRVEEVMGRVEEVGREEGLRVRRRRRGAVVEGRMGGFVAWIEVFRLSGEMVVVELERGSGEEAGRFGSGFWRERLGEGGDLPAVEAGEEASGSG